MSGIYVELPKTAGGGGGPPTGPAGGDLSGTYPNPKVLAVEDGSGHVIFYGPTSGISDSSGVLSIDAQSRLMWDANGPSMGVYSIDYNTRQLNSADNEIMMDWSSYSSGLLLRGQTLYFDNNQIIDSSGNLQYPGNGALTYNAGAWLLSPGGALLADQSNNLYYGNGPILADPNGSFFYNTGAKFLDSNGNIYFPDGSTVFIDNNGDLFYPTNDKLADTNGNLYVPDNGQLIIGDTGSYHISGYISGGNAPQFGFFNTDGSRAVAMGWQDTPASFFRFYDDASAESFSLFDTGGIGLGTSTSTGSALSHYKFQFDSANSIANFQANFAITTAGKGLLVKEGSNAKQGLTAAMTAGSIVVSNTAVTANSRIFLTAQNTGGTPGSLRVSARTAGTSFTITSTSATDTSTVAYQIFEPA